MHQSDEKAWSTLSRCEASLLWGSESPEIHQTDEVSATHSGKAEHWSPCTLLFADNLLEFGLLQQAW